MMHECNVLLQLCATFIVGEVYQIEVIVLSTLLVSFAGLKVNYTWSSSLVLADVRVFALVATPIPLYLLLALMLQAWGRTVLCGWLSMELSCWKAQPFAWSPHKLWHISRDGNVYPHCSGLFKRSVWGESIHILCIPSIGDDETGYTFSKWQIETLLIAVVRITPLVTRYCGII